MARQRHLRNAPIAEALVDIRVRAREGFDPRAFEQLTTELHDRYPKVDTQRRVQTGLELREGKPIPQPAVDLGVQGFLFGSADGLEIAQFRIDGFTYNRLKPYTSWADLLPKALSLWSIYVRAAQPKYVTRLALRYVNRLQLPLATADLSTYVSAPPAIPGELSHALGGFFTRLVLRDSASGAITHWIQAMEPGSGGVDINLLLDIDTYIHEEFDTSQETLRPRLETLHDVKNQVFFASLTNRAVEAYE